VRIFIAGMGHPSRGVGRERQGLPNSANVDGLKLSTTTHFYLSFSGTNTTVAGPRGRPGRRYCLLQQWVWSIYFDGTAHGLTSSGLDIDAVDIGPPLPPPPPPTLTSIVPPAGCRVPALRWPLPAPT